MHVSYAELMRVAPEVLRMLGDSPYGQAYEAVEAFMMTHAALDKGYALTRISRQTAGPWKISVDDSDPAITRVNLGGASLVLHAASLADAFVSGRRSGGRIIVSGTNGGWVAPYIAFRIARHGLGCRITWIPEKASADEAPPQETIASHPDEVAVSSLVADDKPNAGLCIHPADDHAPPSDALRIDFAKKVRELIAAGRETDPSEHSKDFLAIAARLRVVASQRSRAQAG